MIPQRRRGALPKVAQGGGLRLVQLSRSVEAPITTTSGLQYKTDFSEQLFLRVLKMASVVLRPSFLVVHSN